MTGRQKLFTGDINVAQLLCLKKYTQKLVCGCDHFSCTQFTGTRIYSAVM